MKKVKTHITADVPISLLNKVDRQVIKLGVSRSFAIRQGLALFLSQYSQDLTKNVKLIDGSARVEEATP